MTGFGVLLQAFMAALPDHPDRALVQAALRGKKSAQTLLIRRLNPVICAHIRRALPKMTRFDEVGHDLVQRTWLRLWADGGKVLKRFDPSRASLEHYVGRIVTRDEVHRWWQGQNAQKRGGQYRHHSLETVMETADCHQSPEVALGNAELSRQVFSHLDTQLSTRGRLIMRLAFVDDLTAEEIAQTLSIRTSAVYNWLSRIRKQARVFLQTA